MALSPNQVKNVCNAGNPTWYGGAHVCKYLDHQYRNGLTVYVCTKLTPAAYADLEKNRRGYGVKPQADHCKGFPLLLITPQGYDVI